MMHGATTGNLVHYIGAGIPIVLTVKSSQPITYQLGYVVRVTELYSYGSCLILITEVLSVYSPSGHPLVASLNMIAAQSSWESPFYFELF